METRKMPTIRIKHKGIFDINDILQGIKDFLEDDYFKFHFPQHKFKIPTPKGGEHKLKMYGERKVNEYVKYKINLYIRVFDYTEIEVIKEGKKVKMFNGRLYAEVSGDLILDFEKRFGGSAFLQGLQDFFHKYVIRRKIEDYWEDDIILKMVNLGKLIREKCEQEART